MNFLVCREDVSVLTRIFFAENLEVEVDVDCSIHLKYYNLSFCFFSHFSDMMCSLMKTFWAQILSV